MNQNLTVCLVFFITEIIMMLSMRSYRWPEATEKMLMSACPPAGLLLPGMRLEPILLALERYLLACAPATPAWASSLSACSAMFSATVLEASRTSSSSMPGLRESLGNKVAPLKDIRAISVLLSCSAGF